MVAVGLWMLLAFGFCFQAHKTEEITQNKTITFFWKKTFFSMINSEQLCDIIQKEEYFEEFLCFYEEFENDIVMEVPLKN